MKSHKVKTTTFDPFMYVEDYYLYGDPLELDNSKDYFFGYFIKQFWEEYYDVIDVTLQIYEITCFVGFFINLIHLFILTRKELRGNLVYFVMTGICICDIIQCFGKMAQLIMDHDIIYKIESCADGYKHIHLMVDLVSETAQMMCRRCSGFLVLYIAAFRTISVMFPMSNTTHKLMNSKSGYFVVFLSGLVCMGWGLGYYFQTRFEKVLVCWIEEKRPSYVPYRVIVDEKWELKYLLIDGVFALVTSGLYVIVAVILLIALCKNRKRRKNLNNDNKPSNTSYMVGFMALTVFISETTYGLFYLANYLVFQNYEEQSYYKKLNSLVWTFQIFNSVIHVIICFFMSSQYRDTVKGLICRSKKQNATKTVLENTINLANEASKVSDSSKKTY